MDKFFTPHRIYFISNPHHINKLWILEKPLLKPKRAHIHKMTPKPMVQPHGDIISSKAIVQAHGTISHFRFMIQAHEPHRGNFESRGSEGQEVCPVKFQQFKVDKGNMLLGISSQVPEL